MMTVELHRLDTGALLDTFTTTSAPAWPDAISAIVYWLRIEVLPYWPPNTLRLSLSSGTYTTVTIAAIYSIGLAFGMPDHNMAVYL